MATVLAIANQKGGVGKTTTSVNLAASLVATQRKVLLVDVDPQGNATTGSGLDKYRLEASVYDVLVHGDPIRGITLPSPEGGFDVVGANGDLTAAEVELINIARRERRLHDALLTVSPDYDYVLIDCPPALNMLTLNGLVAADGVLITMQCEYYALEGLSALLQTIERLRQGVNPGLRIEGVLRTMYDPRNKLTLEVSAQLQQHFGEQLYRTVIPRNVRLAEAPSFGLPALQFDAKSSGAMAYLALAGEMIRRNQRAPLGSEKSVSGNSLKEVESGG